MSFRCGQCHQAAKPGTPMIRMLVERRDRQYVNDKGHQSVGWEIKREMSICTTCAGIKPVPAAQPAPVTTKPAPFASA